VRCGGPGGRCVGLGSLAADAVAGQRQPPGVENGSMAYRRAALVAVLADVHGNLPALSAVLAEPDVAAADAVVLLGDIALGPMPAETLEVLAGLGEAYRAYMRRTKRIIPYIV